MIDCRDVVGIPFVKKGDSIQGFDCLGLCMYMLHKIGIATPEFHNLDNYDSKSDNFADLVKLGLKAKKVATPTEGCLLEFKCEGNYHVGFCIDDKRFVHACTTQGKVVIDTISRWKSKLQGVYRVNN